MNAYPTIPLDLWNVGLMSIDDILALMPRTSQNIFGNPEGKFTNNNLLIPKELKEPQGPSESKIEPRSRLSRISVSPERDYKTHKARTYSPGDGDLVLPERTRRNKPPQILPYQNKEITSTDSEMARQQPYYYFPSGPSSAAQRIGLNDPFDGEPHGGGENKGGSVDSLDKQQVDVRVGEKEFYNVLADEGDGVDIDNDDNGVDNDDNDSDDHDGGDCFIEEISQVTVSKEQKEIETIHPILPAKMTEILPTVMTVTRNLPVLTDIQRDLSPFETGVTDRELLLGWPPVTKEEAVQGIYICMSTCRNK